MKITLTWIGVAFSTLLAFGAVSPFALNVFAAQPVEIPSIPSIFWTPQARAESTDSDALFSRLIQEEWSREDKLDGQTSTWVGAARRHFDAAKNLFDVLRDELDSEFASQTETSLTSLESRLSDAEKNAPTPIDAEKLYAEIRGLKRAIVFSNPLYRGYELLFCKRVPSGYSHMVAQYLGWRARPGGGLFVLEEPGRSLKTRALTDGVLPTGSVLEPRLSYDAKKIVFSFVDLSSGREYDPTQVHFNDPDEGFYHLWTIDVDGKNARQITAGSFDDLTPTWLPDGDLIFSSTRRKGFARCFWWGFGRRWNTFTLHRVKPDGTEIKTLSWHDTCEWFPAVASDGSVVYARWDYIDRDAVTHQNLWSSRPDGTNPKAVWGNATPNPQCVFQPRPIPGSNKFVFTASAHHSITGGSLVILDPSVGVDGPEALRRITPETPFPETEGWGIPDYYESPFPLSEEFFITSYSPTPLKMEGQSNEPNALGIYALDVFGNRELIYRDPEIGATSAIPLRAETPPPVLPSALPENAEPFGEMTIENVYEGIAPIVAPGTVKEIRIVQIYPKTTRDFPPVGLAGEENARAILGTVPVEEDGSAFFRVPAKTSFLLQCLDAEGRAVQTMRSLTYLQPGERVSCVGCHEKRDSAAVATNVVLSNGARSIASARPASEIDPGELGGRPFSYVETIQPILDAKCVSCHNDADPQGGINLSGAPQDPEFDYGTTIMDEGKSSSHKAPADIFTKSYFALCEGRAIFWGDDGNNPEKVEKALVPRFGGRNTIQVTEPGGRYGSVGSRLMKILRAGHEGVELTDREWRCFNAWIDLNAIFYGVYEPEDQARQLRGERVEAPAIQ